MRQPECLNYPYFSCQNPLGQLSVKDLPSDDMTVTCFDRVLWCPEPRWPACQLV